MRAFAFDSRWARRQHLRIILREAGLLQPGDFSKGVDPPSVTSDDSENTLVDSDEDTETARGLGRGFDMHITQVIIM